jgi:pSer/pThr/pTyr-binding forkhead associated (FHA) protein
MPKLVLLFEGRVIRETAVTLGQPCTIGRLPDNTIVIDNSAVSSHHVRVAREGPQFVVEDLGAPTARS